ncbi:MAG: hypothetical protein KGQ41_08890 [Alphaproteobacteria bacterium]|nr:hypothetical protein [Alphaproteobacteria bacterium]
MAREPRGLHNLFDSGEPDGGETPREDSSLSTPAATGRRRATAEQATAAVAPVRSSIISKIFKLAALGTVAGGLYIGGVKLADYINTPQMDTPSASNIQLTPEQMAKLREDGRFMHDAIIRIFDQVCYTGTYGNHLPCQALVDFEKISKHSAFGDAGAQAFEKLKREVRLSFINTRYGDVPLIDLINSTIDKRMSTLVRTRLENDSITWVHYKAPVDGVIKSTKDFVATLERINANVLRSEMAKYASLDTLRADIAKIDPNCWGKLMSTSPRPASCGPVPPIRYR